MKAFDKWYGDYLDVAGDEIYTAEERMESAFRAGMLAAADMVESYSDLQGGYPLERYPINNEIADHLRCEANTD